MAMLPLPHDSASHMVRGEPEFAGQISWMAKSDRRVGITRANMSLKTGIVLGAGTVNAVPIEPLAEAFGRTQLPSAPPPLTIALRRTPFFPVSPQESVLDEGVRELAERALNPALIPLVQMHFPDFDLEHTIPTMNRCGYWLPLDTRWQRKRTAWDRGARWKSPTSVGILPSGNLIISQLQSGGPI
jgi:hypothetical protein